MIRNSYTRIGRFLSNPKQDQKLAAKNRIRHEMHIKPDHIVEKKEKRRHLSIIVIDINRTNRKNNNIRYPKHNKQDIKGKRSDGKLLVASLSLLGLCPTQLDISPRISKQFNRIE